MARGIQQNSTEYFTVLGSPVGTAYVAEDHVEDGAHHAAIAETRESGVATLWLLLYGAIISISLFAEAGAGKWLNTAALLAQH
jgi:hypothetical protein